MPNYRRLRQQGGTYFFTQVTGDRFPWLDGEIGRKALRNAIDSVRINHPFEVQGIVLLPDHIHCIWTLPQGEDDFPTRWRLLKTYVTNQLKGRYPKDSIWQKRYWEHLIRDETDLENHLNYIHYNPVKHGLCKAPKDWAYSSFHRFVSQGIYPQDWGANQMPNILPSFNYD